MLNCQPLYRTLYCSFITCLFSTTLWAQPTKLHYKGQVTVNYAINVPVPTFSKDSPYATFNQDIQSELMNHISQYFGSVVANNIAYSEPTPPTLTITGKPQLFQSKHYVSIRFNLSSYVSHAAHPSNDIYTLTYEPQHYMALSLQDLFSQKNNSSSYLIWLSQQCRHLLQSNEYIDKDTMLAGTTPDLANFRNWNLTPKGLLISFVDGQVGPHAIGQPTVLIPLAALLPHLSAQGRQLVGHA